MTELTEQPEIYHSKEYIRCDCCKKPEIGRFYRIEDKEDNNPYSCEHKCENSY